MNDDTNGNVVKKIRKLLRLARDKGATEHEAMTALTMAQRLMMQHNIHDVEEQREIHAIRGEWMEVDKGDKWEMITAQAAAMLFNCRNVVRTRSGAHQFVGKPENVEACGDAFLWICSQIEVLYKEALRTYGGSLSRSGRADLRRSFKYACASRVYWRCKDIVAKARNDIPDHMALVVIDQSLAAADDLIKDLRTTKSRAHKPGIGTIQGLRAGDRVRLQGQVGDKNGE